MMGWVVVLVSVTTAVTSWAAYLRTLASERERTARLRAAIDGVPPEWRSAIILACSRLEVGRGHDGSMSTTGHDVQVRRHLAGGARVV
jgi:hypothetical protein